MLQDDTGGEYGYHFVTFQTEGAPGVVPHLLQATLGDHERGVHYAAERGGAAAGAAGCPERGRGNGRVADAGRTQGI